MLDRIPMVARFQGGCLISLPRPSKSRPAKRDPTGKNGGVCERSLQGRCEESNFSVILGLLVSLKFLVSIDHKYDVLYIQVVSKYAFGMLFCTLYLDEFKVITLDMQIKY